jgi:predicted lactoylglutathione lyase
MRRTRQDQGFMYTRSFHDPDGHHFEVFWMDPNVLEEALPAESAAGTAA